MSRLLWLPCVVVLCHTATVSAEESFRFPEAKHGQGELKYVNDIPILILTGTPEEIGEQMGVLGVKPAADAVAMLDVLLKDHGLEFLRPVLVRFGEERLSRFPEAYRQEFEAMAKASGVDREALVIGNTFGELRHLAGCSGLMIGPERSTTGGPLMGRNWDFRPIEGMDQYNAIVIRRPEGKLPYATITYPGAVASDCTQSAINGAGLAIGGNFIGDSADESPQVDWDKIPPGVVGRRIMEECRSIDETEALIRENHPSERGAMVACDLSGGAVFEVTPKTIAVRRGEGGVCIGTNHFLSEGLMIPQQCWRMDILAEAAKEGKLGVADVAAAMHGANQGDWTAQTMVFEPKTLRLHVAFGDGKRSATEFPLKEIDLSEWLKP